MPDDQRLSSVVTAGSAQHLLSSGGYIADRQPDDPVAEVGYQVQPTAGAST
jgi:hypothetical protein